MPGDRSAPSRYFWSDWFIGQSLETLACVFVLLSLADLAATLRLVAYGVPEGNLLARVVITRYGDTGLICYKLFLVALVVTLGWLIDRRAPSLSRTLLWGGILLMGYVALWHLSLMVSFAL